VFINTEDAKYFGPKHEGGKVKTDDSVERVRRLAYNSSNALERWRCGNLILRMAINKEVYRQK
jgi:hypothetical protein